MSSNEIETECRATITVCNQEIKRIYKLLEEYNRVKLEFEETNDSRKMKQKALELLNSCSPNYDRVFTIMNLAVKIIKVCNGLQK